MKHILPHMCKYDGVCYLLKGRRNTSLKGKNQVVVDSPVKGQQEWLALVLLKTAMTKPRSPGLFFFCG